MFEPYDIFLKEEDEGKNEKPKIIVTDMDDTFCTCAEVAINFIKSNPVFFSPFFDMKKINTLTAVDIINRPIYHLDKWLALPDVEMSDDIKEVYYGIYSRSDFYKFSRPTPFGYALKKFLSHKLCKEIYIATHIVSDKQIDPKMQYILDFFGKENMSKIKFLPIDRSTKKSSVITDNNIEWDSFADDLLENITDMAVNGKGFGNEFLIPRLGYNNSTPEFERTVSLFNMQVFYVDSF